MLDTLQHPWHWSIAGLLIGLFVPLLFWIENRFFGVSSSMRHICAASLPAKIPFFQYDWKKESWNLFFVAGIALGGLFSAIFLRDPDQVVVAEATREALSQYGIADFSRLIPSEIFNWSSFGSMTGWIFVILGGFMVGFGTRYAGGCTSGHSITGISQLQWSSLIATICFFIGGLIMTHLFFPILL